MATRFRKLRTRRSKARKGLKTRRHRGGDVRNTLFGALNRVKGAAEGAASKFTAVFNPNATKTQKKPNEFMEYRPGTPNKEAFKQERLKAYGKK